MTAIYLKSGPLAWEQEVDKEEEEEEEKEEEGGGGVGAGGGGGAVDGKGNGWEVRKSSSAACQQWAAAEREQITDEEVFKSVMVHYIPKHTHSTHTHSPHGKLSNKTSGSADTNK